MKILRAFLWWVVRKLVGDRTVIGNLTVKGGVIHLKPDSEAFIFNSTFEGPKPQVKVS